MTTKLEIEVGELREAALGGSGDRRNPPPRRTSSPMNRETCDCPHCGSPCDRDEVDVDVGVIHGPWGCADCGWSSDPAYDSREGIRPDGEDRVFDQYGVSRHVERLDGMAVLVGLNVRDRGAK